MAVDYSKYRSSPDDDRKFDIAPFDAEAGRVKMIARISRALKQFNKEQGPQGGKDFDIGHNGQVRYKPTLNGQRIFVENEGEDYFPIHSSQFPSLLTDFSRNVDHGHYDKQIEAALTSESVVPATKPAKAAGTRSSSTDPLSGIRKAFGNRMGKQGVTAAEAAAALKAGGKYEEADIDKVLAEKLEAEKAAKTK